MGVVTVRPSSLRDASGLTSGSVASVNDASDSTSLLFTPGGQVTLLFDDPSIPAGAQIRIVQARYRVAAVSGTAYVYSKLFAKYPSGPSNVIGYGWAAGTSIVTYNSHQFSTSPWGRPWNQADLNGLALQLFLNPNIRVYDAWIDVYYNVAPVVAVTAPSGAWTTSVRPEVDWTYTDADGDAQERFHVKIFTTAQYTAGSFDPETSKAVWDSGVVYSAATAAQIPVNLANGATYRAYVKAADVGSGGRGGAWAYSTFNIAVTIPATPTLAVVGTVDMNATLTIGGLTAGNGVVAERSNDGGITWVPVRGSGGWVAAGAVLTAVDYEPPCGIQAQYRAWQWNEDSFSNIFASGYSTVATMLLTNNIIRLKDPSNPGFWIRLRLSSAPRITSPRIEGIFDPLGSSTAVVLTDSTPGGDRIGLDLWFKTELDYRAFKALWATGHVLLLTTDIAGEQWYVQLTGLGETTLEPANRQTRPYRTISCTAVEVDSPPDSAPAPGSS